MFEAVLYLVFFASVAVISARSARADVAYAVLFVSSVLLALIKLLELL